MYEKVRDLLIEHYPTEETDTEKFTYGAKMQEVIAKDRITALSLLPTNCLCLTILWGWRLKG